MCNCFNNVGSDLDHQVAYSTLVSAYLLCSFSLVKLLFSMISFPRFSTLSALTYFAESFLVAYVFEIGFETLVTVYEMDFYFS